MYSLNKFVWAIANPLMVGCLMLGLGIVLKLLGLVTTIGSAKRRRIFKVAWILVALSLVWFWSWGTPAWSRVVGQNLERDFLDADERMVAAVDYPVCDAIVDLGGGCGVRTNMYDGVMLNAAADRAYFSALLWKAGKAPIIIASGSGLELADKVFMQDIGVPEEAIVVENEAMNTEENAKFVEKLIKDCIASFAKATLAEEHVDEKATEAHKPKVLLVTSAWHMKRSLLMFKKYAKAIEVVPAPCDFETIKEDGFAMSDLLPDSGSFECNCRYYHEWLGIWGYKYLRK